MNDGIQSAGAGQDDRMVAGRDLQHYTQNNVPGGSVAPDGADERPVGSTSEIRPLWQAGGPVKEELDRHKQARQQMLSDLQR